MPVSSPIRTILMNSRLKVRGKRLKASLMLEPASSSAPMVVSSLPSLGLMVCLAMISRACRTATPAESMVPSWRQKRIRSSMVTPPNRSARDSLSLVRMSSLPAASRSGAMSIRIGVMLFSTSQVSTWWTISADRFPVISFPEALIAW